MGNTKNIIRAKAKYIRENLDTLNCSNKITEHIFSWDKFKNAKNVMLFYPIGSEFSLLKLLNNKEKSFFFPVVDGENIYPVLHDETKGFKVGSFGIKEPIGAKLTDYSTLDLILIPSLAADKNGHRLGYGKGYYDRFLEHIGPHCTKAVIIFSKLIFDELPIEEHDKTADYLVTELGINKTNYLILSD